MDRDSLKALRQLFRKAHKELVKKDKFREEILRLAREMVRYSAESIRAVHRREWGQAEKMLARVEKLNRTLIQMKKKAPELFYAGTVHDSQKEWVEASFLYAYLRRKKCPRPEDLKVETPAYLKGIGEAVGELRRFVLDNLREEGIIEEQVLETMDAIHFELMKFDFPDALTLGLRRVSDQTRTLTEKTRGEVTLAKALQGKV